VGKHPYMPSSSIFFPLTCHLQVFLTCHFQLFSLYFFLSLFAAGLLISLFFLILFSEVSLYILKTSNLYMKGPQTHILRTKQEPQLGSPSLWSRSNRSNEKDKSKGWDEIFMYGYDCHILKFVCVFLFVHIFH
jgi:hypothetical protein